MVAIGACNRSRYTYSDALPMAQEGWVQGRQETFANKRWIVYASPAEIVRLKQLQQQIKQGCWPPSAQVGNSLTSNNTK